MTELELFRRLVEKYKFTEYIPSEVQKFVLSSKKRVLTSSLKAVNDLGFFYRIVLSVYFDTRILGIKPSIIVSKIIAFAATLVVSGLLITGAVFAVNKSISYFSVKNTASVDSTGVNIPRSITEKNKTGKVNDNSFSVSPGDLLNSPSALKSEKQDIAIKTRLGIDNIIPAGVDNKYAAVTTKLLFENLQKLKGKERVIYTSVDRERKSINRHLLGRLSKVGNVYVMAINIVDTQSGKILYSNTSSYRDENYSGDIIKKIAEDINSKSSSWE